MNGAATNGPEHGTGPYTGRSEAATFLRDSARFFYLSLRYGRYNHTCVRRVHHAGVFARSRVALATGTTASRRGRAGAAGIWERTYCL